MVSYPYEYVRLSLQGTIQNTQQWSVGISCAPDSGSFVPTNAQLTTWLGTLQTAVANWWSTGSGPGALNHSSTVLTRMRADHYLPGGTHANASSVVGLTSSLPGTATGVGPAQVSIVASLLTVLAGKNQRGRLYIPMTGSGVLTSGGVLSTIATDAVANNTATLLTAINATTLAGVGVNVVLRNNQAGPPSVVTVRVDNRPDTQRRRLDKISPSYYKSVNV